MRSGEAWMLKLTDLDFENKLVKVTPEKGGDPRALKISNKLVAMLNVLPKTQSGLQRLTNTFRTIIPRTKVAHIFSVKLRV